MSRFHILDVPNERSLHGRPTPRTGGIAIVAAIVLSAALFAWRGHSVWPALGLGGAVAVIALTSYADDRYGLSVKLRIVVHAVAGSWYVWASWGSNPSTVIWAQEILAVLFIVWMINLYNFMDGMDGFAGGMGVFGFGALAILGLAAGSQAFFVLSLICAAAAAGFLIFNFPPARIFMGDVGSTVLGFLAGAFMLWGLAEDILTLPIALLVFSVFIVDASVTLLRRLLRRENIAQAHRSHYYQRAVQLGFSHRQVVLVEYGLMLGSAATAVVMSHRLLSAQWSALALWGLIYVVAMWLITRTERAKTRI